jgi:hypothetical protein
MSAAIPITRLDRTASELRSFVSKCGDGAQVRRFLAIALVLDGRSRAALDESVIPAVLWVLNGGTIRGYAEFWHARHTKAAELLCRGLAALADHYRIAVPRAA